MEEKTRIIPLGGFDKIGMNIMVIEQDDTIIVVDCGASFYDETIYGVDTVIPDISYLIENIDRVKGIVITHGHEDHIGAIPYILPRLNVPVYTTPLTGALIEKKLDKSSVKRSKIKIVRTGNSITLGSMRVEFIKANHSIPDSAMLAIFTKAGVIVHTGDFKIDYTPIIGESTDLKRLGMLGYKGVLAVVADSTNALQEGTSKSELNVVEAINNLFDKCRKGRIFISVFSSNIDRVQQILLLADKYNRKVVIQGELILDIFETVKKLSLINIPDEVIIPLDEIGKYEDDELLFITTGNHGEAFSYLADIANDINPAIHIKAGDNIIFSSIPINRYEKMFSELMNKLCEKRANIFCQETHVTGHACAEEIKLLYNLLSPRYVIPAHGDYRMRYASGKLAERVGISEDNIMYIDNGDILELGKDSAKVIGTAPHKEIFVEGLVVGNESNGVLEQRYKMSEAGVVALNVCFDAKSELLTAPPHCVLAGFGDSELEHAVSEATEEIALNVIGKCVDRGIRHTRMKNYIKKAIFEFFWEKYKRKPLIIVEIRSTLA